MMAITIPAIAPPDSPVSELSGSWGLSETEHMIQNIIIAVCKTDGIEEIYYSDMFLNSTQE